MRLQLLHPDIPGKRVEGKWVFGSLQLQKLFHLLRWWCLDVFIQDDMSTTHPASVLVRCTSSSHLTQYSPVF